MISDHLKGILIIVAGGILGYLYKELQRVIRSIENHSLRIDHLEADNKQHKDNYKELYESLFNMVKELKQDISDLKETIIKNTHE